MRRLILNIACLQLILSCSSSNKPSSDSLASTSKEPSQAIPMLKGEPPAEGDPREQSVSAAVAALLSQDHVRNQAIDDSLSQKAFSEYLKNLDSDKVFLLKEDIDSLKTHEFDMDDQIKTGHLKLAHDAEKKLSAQYTVVQGIVKELLKTPFDLTKAETIETDGEKLAWAVDNDALKERWRKELKFQVLGRISRMEAREELKKKLALKTKDGKKAPSQSKDSAEDDENPELETRASRAPIPATFEGKEAKAREDLAKSYDARFNRLLDTEPLEPVATFLNAITSIYDPHTLYLPPNEKESFDIQMSGSLEGIGAVLSEDEHYIRVVEVVPGGPSWKQGDLEAGDLILSVAQQDKDTVDIADMRINKVVQMIRGKKGSIVTLTVEKADGSVKTVQITRDIVSIEATYARAAFIKTNKMPAKIGYVYLPSFYGSTRSLGQASKRGAAKDVSTIMSLFAAQKVKGAILDMRGNGGGFLDDARVMTGLFIEDGPVVQTGTPTKVTEVLEDKDDNIVFDAPLVVLVDRFSASASEIVAGALQDYNRAVIVGAPSTHGKGTVQAVVQLERFAESPNGKPLGVLKITVQQFFRINGESTQWKGVEPDIALVDGAAHLESGEKHLDHSLPWATVDKLKFDLWPKANWDENKLSAASQKRQAKNSFFNVIKNRSALLAARRKRTEFPISYKKYTTLLESEKKEIEKLDPEKELKRKKRIKVDILDYDGAMAKAKATREGRKTGRSPSGWAKGLENDAVVEEGLNILRDMGVR